MTALALPSVIRENKHISELTELLGKHGKTEDAKDIADVFDCICGMESDLKKAIDEIATLRSELSVMREEQKHPIKTMLHRAADSIMSKLKSAYRQVLALKDKFIGGCKQAVEDIKDKGIIAANGVVCVLNVKADLESSKERINEVIAYKEKKIAAIDTAAEQYHTAGRALKNIGRVLVGKEAVPDIKPNGKLTKLLQAPFRSEIKGLKRSLARTDKVLERLDKLEKAAVISAERSRASVLDEVKQHRETTRSVPELAVPKRLRIASQEL